MHATPSASIDFLADADGHVIEPGDLWIERLPRDLRPLAPHFFRDEQGVFHSKRLLTAASVASLDGPGTVTSRRVPGPARRASSPIVSAS